MSKKSDTVKSPTGVVSITTKPVVASILLLLLGRIISDKLLKNSPESISKDVKTMESTVYNSLRSSIDMRVRLRNQLISYSITFFGAILALTVHESFPPNTMLIFPVIAFFLALEWTHLDARIELMADYIEENIEKNLEEKLRWYEYLTNDKIEKEERLRANVLAASGVFLGESFLAFGISVFQFCKLDDAKISNIDFLIFGGNIVVMVFTSILLCRRAPSKMKKKLEQVSSPNRSSAAASDR